MEQRPEYGGMTVNERFFAAEILPEWDAAVRARNCKRMVELLSRVDLADQAEQIANAVLANPQRYGF